VAQKAIVRGGGEVMDAQGTIALQQPRWCGVVTSAVAYARYKCPMGGDAEPGLFTAWRRHCCLNVSFLNQQSKARSATG
jgi:hypothetical protein